jgi:hypothetical protein
MRFGLDGSPALNQPDDDHDYGQNQQDMDEAPHRIR